MILAKSLLKEPLWVVPRILATSHGLESAIPSANGRSSCLTADVRLDLENPLSFVSLLPLSHFPIQPIHKMASSLRPSVQLIFKIGAKVT